MHVKEVREAFETIEEYKQRMITYRNNIGDINNQIS